MQKYAKTKCGRTGQHVDMPLTRIDDDPDHPEWTHTVHCPGCGETWKTSLDGWTIVEY